MRISCLFAIALTVICLAHAGLVEEPGSTNENVNRFLIDEGALAISRPDETWKFDANVSDPPTVAGISSPDGAAVADIQVQQVPGVTLAQIKEPIEQAVAAQRQDFNKLSGRDIVVLGLPAYELVFTVTWEGATHKAKMLVVKPGDTLYIVKCRAPAEAWPRFETEFDRILASVELLSKRPWGRRIEWEREAGPEAREHASFMLDPNRDRALMLLGSGYQPHLDPLGDAWTFNLNNDSWSKLELQGDPITPGGSRRAARVKDGAFIHGGYGKDMSASGDLWELEYDRTQVRVRRVEQDHAPEPRSLHAFAVDTKGERFVIFGGGTTAGVLGDTWIGMKRGKKVSWRRLDLDVSPGPRYGFAFAHDEKRGLLIVSGGQRPSRDGSESFALDSWALNFAASDPKWTMLAEYDSLEFPGRRNPAFTFDQRTGNLFVWGGAGAGDSLIPDLFIVHTRENKAPVRRVAQSPLIPTRASGFAVVDPKRSRVLMGFGNIAAGPFLDLVEVEIRQ